MPWCSRSNLVKRKEDLDFEKWIKEAKDDLVKGKCISVREVAEVHGLAASTLRDQIGGKTSQQEAHVSQQKLTPIEEKAIKTWLIRLDDWRFPMQHQYVNDMPIDFLRSHGVENPQLDKNWITRFLLRHLYLASKFATRLDKQSTYADNPDLLRDFYEKVQQPKSLFISSYYHIL